MLNSKLTSLESFPRIMLPTINGHIIELTNHSLISDWTMVIIYRGHHSKNCTEFLNLLNSFHQQFADIGITIIAASADNREQLQQHLKQLTVSFPIACELSVEQMYQLNLHLSVPKDFQETNHPFAEPALFIVDEQSQIILSDITNNPYTRPNLDLLLSGLTELKSQS